MRKGIFIFLIYLLFNSCSELTQQPNVVLIICDDLGHWVGYMDKNPIIKTPNINHLVNRGVAFTHCYATSPESKPSRASIFTGKHPLQTGLYKQENSWESAIKKGETIESHFKSNGYFVAASGAVHPYIADENYGAHKYKPFTELTTLTPVEEGRAAGLTWNMIGNTDSVHLRDCQVTDFIIEQIQNPLPKPFFLIAGLSSTSAPFNVPEKYFDLNPKDIPYLPKIQDWDLDDISVSKLYDTFPLKNHYTQKDSLSELFALSRAYMASITFLDYQIGKILKSLGEGEDLQNTIVVLIGDNGILTGEKHHFGGPSLWEENLHIPLIISAPRTALKGKTCFKVCDATSLFPTLCDLARLPIPEDVQVESLKPWVQNPLKQSDSYAVSMYGKQNYTIRTRNYRYINYNNGEKELYHNKTDDREWLNLAYYKRYRDFIRDLEKEF